MTTILPAQPEITAHLDKFGRIVLCADGAEIPISKDSVIGVIDWLLIGAGMLDIGLARTVRPGAWQDVELPDGRVPVPFDYEPVEATDNAQI